MTLPDPSLNLPKSAAAKIQILPIIALIFAVFFVYAAEPVPAVNESHYLLKAFVTYHPQPLSQDIFLGSADTHWLFFQISGLLTLFSSLEVTAWILRIVGWGALAYGWYRLVAASQLPLIVSPFLAAAWLCGMHYGQLSGEWVVGGIEAKVIAYAFVFIGWSYMLGDKKHFAWPCLGAASAFHVLVGGWAVVATGLALVFTHFSHCKLNFKSHLVALLIGGALSLPGLVPAVNTMAGVSAADDLQAAQIYVYERIPHHLCFSKFSEKRRTAFLVPLIGFFAASLIYWTTRRFSQLSLGNSPAQPLTTDENQTLLSKTKLWIGLGVATLVIALIGIIIEQIGYQTNPATAAKLLKFYWFRLVDPVIPMAAIFVMALVIQRCGMLLTDRHATRSQQYVSVAFWLSIVLLGAWVLQDRFSQLTKTEMAEANYRSLPVRDKTPEERELIYQDWLRVCSWVATNTPEDSLWLTPRHQQTFKWYTRRSELACWKDIPQDSKSMVQWWTRLKDAYQKDEQDEWVPWTAGRLYELNAKYGIRYVLVDRRIQTDPPLLPMIYPIDGQWNDSYAIFEIIP
jgi:hypothetical protein